MIRDPNLLLSYLNTKLRDDYPSIDELCSALDYSKEEIDEILNPVGYFYDPESNQYKAK